MISSFFGKTKPINYIVLSVFLSFFYGMFLFLGSERNINVDVLPLELLTLTVLLFSIYLISRIVRVEKVTDLSSFAILFFVLLLVAFSNVLIDKNGIFTNFFVLLAVWRLLSIKSIKNVKHKIFDASFLICVASFFYDWALVFLILVFVVINIYDRKTTKNWMVPIAAIISVFILSFAIFKLYDMLHFYREHYRFSLGLLNTNFPSQPGITKLIIYASLILLVTFLVFLKVRKKGGGKLLPLRIIFLTFLIGLFISLFESMDSSLLLLTFFPAAVFLTNYLEAIKKARLKEAVIVISVLLSFLVFALELNP
ncbi:hypothetical protein FVB32_04805 [Flagellimonas hymeniacidonis]|uniref:Uncharacterized protein n=1 Tax=Flagellimonas hymeniacidonis TaxID=2603628 RepID=A0A5C8V766_9FLAO|nr:DUF6427 family protein [Flagellimonas hymeniacidonis]TXN37611.1 hypothetical protein FVB32_04805 [Flagellimonas hymeniacidonis]